VNIQVVYCPRPGHVDCVTLALPPGACLRDAVVASGLCQRHGLELATVQAGVWGRKQPLEWPLREHDRVELYRPLRVDPKEARRLRYKRAQAAKPAVGR
jgi:putative ubiquitin-RnfH superfamily antitoxin RatB of RatAB toxin-antitoxin module